MFNEAVTIKRAHKLDTLSVDFDEELSKLSGDKLKMIRDSRKFHFTNYYKYMEVQYKLITRYTGVPDTYHSRIATITILLYFLHLVFPSNTKRDYDAKRVVPILVGIDVENMPETLAVGELNEKHKNEFTLNVLFHLSLQPTDLQTSIYTVM
ncbi:uncharacterized protein EV154DRAFT_557722 [Mucor mucedo]|uniref:uncharacterized protein n=1 Tax=Mucor mucedo TaxID=29922 RepID=UPI00221F371B|nr:uncharacterized protein EV154DRAFT_557722 [Mucor mucedo]KAI7897419.1 hypothetical protein EV154DRAFT_557722 [Mucor mucedo]